MLRRVALLLRLSLFALGLAGLLWMPVSYYFWAHLLTPVEGLQIYSANGSVTCSWPHRPWHYFPEWRLTDWLPNIYTALSHLVSNSFAQTLVLFEKSEFEAYTTSGTSILYQGTFITFPIWLLAFLCLAWPVTSFVIARRRRRGRGFEVEAVGGNAVSTVDS